ncbi:MAG: GYF domain-containing protein [Phycisphaerae bacterium]|nr:GYF domain-containing protein [Phycisphaerae bacterium]
MKGKSRSVPQKWVYFFADGNVRRGPYPLEELREFPLRPETMVWRAGLTGWMPLREVPELWAVFAERFVSPVPPPSPGAPQSLQVPQTPFLPEGWMTGGRAERSPGALAIASLVTGIAGLAWWCLPGSVFVGAPLAVAAIVLGAMGRRQVRRGIAGGGRSATTGLILGAINLLLIFVVVGLVVWVATETAPSPLPEFPATLPVE